MRRIGFFILFNLLWAGLASNFTSAAPGAGRHPFKVVIDPGHGGTDYGTIFDNQVIRIAEKEATLLLAKGVAQELKSRGIEATLTRQDDRDIPLGARTGLANRLGADLFLSIHMNSTQILGTHDAEGIETYILNNATDASSRRLAHLENTVISHEGIETPAQADVALILRDLRLDGNLSESKRLACSIQSNLTISQHRSRGVKQALFHVLLGADMPSVLLEAGFLSNSHDRALVLSLRGRRTMSIAIARAILQFKTTKGTPSAATALSRCKVN